MNLEPNFSKKTIILINLILFEVFLICLSGMYSYYSVEKLFGIGASLVSRVSLGAGLVVAVASIILLREINRLAEKEKEAGLNELMLQQSRETVDLLRMQGHDFMNHLQVVHGMLELKKVDRAMDYIKEISGEDKGNTYLNNIENPVLAALISKKTMQAEKFGVKIFIDVQSRLRGIAVSHSEIAGILGNLLDNAITAARQDLGRQGIVELELYEQDSSFVFFVRNSGSAIPEEIRDNIFEKGFSTKSEEGHGYGLFIVKNLVERYGGTIQCNTCEKDGTTFITTIPKISEHP